MPTTSNRKCTHTKDGNNYYRTQAERQEDSYFPADARQVNLNKADKTSRTNIKTDQISDNDDKLQQQTETLTLNSQ